MDNRIKYYTYTHATPDGDIFYVGKGTGHRAYSSGKRPIIWKIKVENCGGINIKIVECFNRESDAFEHEKSLIAYYTKLGCNLINQTLGGAGTLGYCLSEDARNHKRTLMTGYKHKEITCPNCHTKGGETSMKRWHFDKCRGAKLYKSRATVNGKRIFLGNYATPDEALQVKQKFLAEAV